MTDDFIHVAVSMMMRSIKLATAMAGKDAIAATLQYLLNNDLEIPEDSLPQPENAPTATPAESETPEL